MHRGHDVGTNTESHEKHRHRSRRRNKQRRREHQADRPGAMSAVRRQHSNELVGFHAYCSRNLAVRLATPRCSATRTAPSVMPNFAAVALIDELSTAID